MNKPLVIFGSGDLAELALYYFTHDSPYDVAAFTLDAAYITEDKCCGLPVISFDTVSSVYPPNEYEIFIALSYSKLNEVRKNKYNEAKSMGYSFASYISSRATVLNNGDIGDNCFILENNTVQPFVKIGSNVTLWSGNHIGHHSVIENHNFLASHVVVSGGVTICEQCFIGVNSTLRDHITVGKKSVIGAGVLVLGDVEPEGLYIGSATTRARLPSTKLRGI
jgi:sugar O-acyltransferase (sialic acid O-acetyltransferase NeuD family)